jgi:tetratricopeptide (TPR) repeat protein
MNREPTPAPITSSPRLFCRRRLIVTALVVLVLSGGLYAWFRPRTSPTEPPGPDLAEVDPEVAEAITAAREAVLQHRASAYNWGRLGMVLRAHDFGGDANRCFQEAERLDPREPRWPYLQGLSLVLTDPASGIPCLERAAERSGNVSAPRLRLAEVLLGQGRLDEAREHIERVQRREPNNRRVLLGLGRLAILREQWRIALHDLEPCTEDEHAGKMAHTLRAEAYARLGEPEKARAEERQAAQAPEDQLWPDPFVEEVLQLRCGLRFRLDRAAALFRSERYSEAVRLLEETVSRYPRSTGARLQLADTWRTLGQPERAEQTLLAAVQLDADSAEAWFRLGCIQALRKQPGEAADSFRRAIRLKPDHALAHFNLGQCLKQQGDPSGAAEEFRSALRCRPDYAAAQEALVDLEKKKR